MFFDEFRVPRQRFLIGAGLGLIATVVAACSTYGKKPEESSEASPPATTTETAGPGVGSAPATALANTADVPVGSGLIVNEVVITQPSAGQFMGFSAKCTHKGCLVDKVAEGTIDCPCHGSKFNLDGSVANGPADKPLEAVAVSVQGDSIVLS